MDIAGADVSHDYPTTQRSKQDKANEDNLKEFTQM